MKIVLFQPQIPQNTGNIGRLCVATNTPLILVRPLGFFIDSKEIRRSGLDYWDRLELTVLNSLVEVQKKHPDSRLLLFSKTGKNIYSDVSYQKEDLLVFGSETEGLPASLLKDQVDKTVRIPMWGPVRSLNLSTTAGIALYEAYRQLAKIPSTL